MFVLNNYITPDGGRTCPILLHLLFNLATHLNSDLFQVTDSDVKETNIPSNTVDKNADEYDFINIVQH